MSNKIYAEENLALVIQYSIENLERTINKKLEDTNQAISFVPSEFLEVKETGGLGLTSAGRKQAHNTILRYFNFNAFAKYSPANVINAMLMAVLNKRNTVDAAQKAEKTKEEENHAFAGLPIQTVERLQKIATAELKRREAFSSLLISDPVKNEEVSLKEDTKDTPNE